MKGNANGAKSNLVCFVDLLLNALPYPFKQCEYVAIRWTHTQFYGWHSCVSVVAFQRLAACWPIDANGNTHCPVNLCMFSLCVHSFAWSSPQIHWTQSIALILDWGRKRNKQKAHNNIISLMIYVIPLERQAKTTVPSHSSKLELWIGWLCVVFGFSLWSFCAVSVSFSPF